MKLLITLTFWGTLLAGSCLGLDAPPNVVFILADDMGYGDVSALNPESKIKTPHLDRLAKEGMIFSDAHSPSSVCTPTRYGVLTGRYCWRTRLKKGVLYNYQGALMDPARCNVASFLKAQGYNTSMVGKWHLGLNWAAQGGGVTEKENEVDFSQPFRMGPADLGFDSFFGITASLDMPPYVYLVNDRVQNIPSFREGKKRGFGREGLVEGDLKPSDFLPEFTRQAVSIIEAQSPDKPFFLYMPLNAPHTPIAPSPAFRGKSKLGKYGDFCIEVDASVGAVMEALQRKGLADNTLLIFTADNGCSPAAGTAKLEKQGHFASQQYRGYKADLWDGGHRVPFIARWPKGVQAGSRSDVPVCLTDLLATCAELVQVPLPDDAGEDSLSLLPALKGQPVDLNRRAAVVHHSINGSFAVRRGKWKLLFCPGSGGWARPRDEAARKQGLPEIQLYDLAADPGEKNNLHAQHPEVVSELKALLTQYVRNGRSTSGPAQENNPDWGRYLHWMQGAE